MNLGNLFHTFKDGLGKADDYIEQVAPDGKARIRVTQDTSMSAVAARWNASQIYGAANLPDNFTTRRVIEVQGSDGAWVPVTGAKNAIPDTETQVAAFQSWRETGIIGPQPVNKAGSEALSPEAAAIDAAPVAPVAGQTPIPERSAAQAAIDAAGPPSFAEGVSENDKTWLQTIGPGVPSKAPQRPAIDDIVEPAGQKSSDDGATARRIAETRKSLIATPESNAAAQQAARPAPETINATRRIEQLAALMTEWAQSGIGSGQARTN